MNHHIQLKDEGKRVTIFKSLCCVIQTYSIINHKAEQNKMLQLLKNYTSVAAAVLYADMLYIGWKHLFSSYKKVVNSRSQIQK